MRAHGRHPVPRAHLSETSAAPPRRCSMAVRSRRRPWPSVCSEHSKGRHSADRRSRRPAHRSAPEKSGHEREAERPKVAVEAEDGLDAEAFRQDCRRCVSETEHQLRVPLRQRECLLLHGRTDRQHPKRRELSARPTASRNARAALSPASWRRRVADSSTTSLEVTSLTPSSTSPLRTTARRPWWRRSSQREAPPERRRVSSSRRGREVRPSTR
jgi:hypothetical protein